MLRENSKPESSGDGAGVGGGGRHFYYFIINSLGTASVPIRTMLTPSKDSVPNNLINLH